MWHEGSSLLMGSLRKKVPRYGWHGPAVDRLLRIMSACQSPDQGRYFDGRGGWPESRSLNQLGCLAPSGSRERAPCSMCWSCWMVSRCWVSSQSITRIQHSIHANGLFTWCSILVTPLGGSKDKHTTFTNQVIRSLADLLRPDRIETGHTQHILVTTDQVHKSTNHLIKSTNHIGTNLREIPPTDYYAGLVYWAVPIAGVVTMIPRLTVERLTISDHLWELWYIRSHKLNRVVSARQ